MADTRYYPPRRPGVTIYLHVADIVDMMGQTQLLQCMTKEELDAISASIASELSTRENHHEPQ